MMGRHRCWIWSAAVVGLTALFLPSVQIGSHATEVLVSHWQWPEDRVEITPYLLELDPDSAVLCWVSPVENVGRVEVRSLNGVHEIREASVTRYHKVELQGLRPATFYRYEIDGLYQGDFVTPENDRSFRAAVVGHTHGTEEKLHYPDELLVARMVELAPDIAIHCGDTTYHATVGEFRRFFFKLFAPALRRFPVFVAAGNHDSGWPGVHGISFDNFRRLFPYEYGGDEEAYYSFEHKHAKFMALSYLTLGFGKNSRQYQWLGKELQESTSEFNIVFLGGTLVEKKFSELFEFLSDYRVDVVLGGDGAGAFYEEINGIPYFFTGTKFRNPHPIRLMKFEEYSLTLRELDAEGKMGPTLHTVNSRLPKVTVLDLTDTTKRPVVFKEERVATLSFEGFHSGETLNFPSIDLDSAAFDGIFVKARCRGSLDGSLRVDWRSSEMIEKSAQFKKNNQRWDRLQKVELSTASELGFSMAMPKVDPLTGRSYRLADLRLVNTSKGCEEAIELTEFYLFRDQE